MTVLTEKICEIKFEFLNLILKHSQMINPLSSSVALIQKPVNGTANQLTGFYMTATLALHGLKSSGPANIYLFKISNRNTRKMYEVCSKLRIKTEFIVKETYVNFFKLCRRTY